MNKQEWLFIKQTKQVPMELFYEFYLIHNDKEVVMEREDFREKLQMYVNTIGRIPIQKMFEYYDKQLGVTKLFDKNKNLIKEY